MTQAFFIFMDSGYTKRQSVESVTFPLLEGVLEREGHCA